MSTLEKGKKEHEHKWQMQEGYILKCMECGKYSIVSKPPKPCENVCTFKEQYHNIMSNSPVRDAIRSIR